MNQLWKKKKEIKRVKTLASNEACFHKKINNFGGSWETSHLRLITNDLLKNLHGFHSQFKRVCHTKHDSSSRFGLYRVHCLYFVYILYHVTICTVYRKLLLNFVYVHVLGT